MPKNQTKVKHMISISRLVVVALTLLLTGAFLLTTISINPRAASGQALSQAERDALEAEIAILEAEIAAQEVELAKQRANTNSIQGEINLLANEIANTQSKIRSKQARIRSLNQSIAEKNRTVRTLTEDLEEGKKSLAQVLREKDEIDTYTFVEVMLSNKDLSEFFVDADSFLLIQQELEDRFDELRGIKTKTEEERVALEQTKIEEDGVRLALESDKKQVESKKGEQDYLLSVSKSKEKSYQDIIDERKGKIVEIRARLFTFQDSSTIPFGQAYDYAKAAGEAVGVRPAFILAILAQETGYDGSTFGLNVGTCYLRDTETGAGVTKNSGTPRNKVMKPSRDVGPFLTITRELGLDPFNTPVSCPIPNVPGWGGAMGFTQFIPSTWTFYKKQIAQVVGVSVASPWVPRHAITGTAIFVADLGADKGGYNNEIEAACKYYSGVSCTHPTVKNLFYGKGVMSKAANIQQDIDFIEGR